MTDRVAPHQFTETHSSGASDPYNCSLRNRFRDPVGYPDGQEGGYESSSFPEGEVFSFDDEVAPYIPSLGPRTPREAPREERSDNHDNIRELGDHPRIGEGNHRHLEDHPTLPPSPRSMDYMMKGGFRGDHSRTSPAAEDRDSRLSRFELHAPYAYDPPGTLQGGNGQDRFPLHQAGHSSLESGANDNSSHWRHMQSMMNPIDEEEVFDPPGKLHHLFLLVGWEGVRHWN